MKWGVIELYCPNCGVSFKTGDKTLYHMHEFGFVCGKKCHDELALKDARSILGKDSLT